MKHLLFAIVLGLTVAACNNAPIPSPSKPGLPCGLNAESCPMKMCCDRPYQCAANGSCTYSGGGNSGDLFGAAKSKPQRPER